MVNRLAQSSSPYLLQHKDNPVDWHEWDSAAFAEAVRRDVPVLLSVGYSACHWCHVMAHESFEDSETAAEMNRHFVNIKVDREERPDVDSIYMQAVQAMSGHGGWPMTVFMTPEGRPFYAGTYYPKTDRHGTPSFRKVLAAVSDAWENRRDDLLSQAEQLTAAIGRDLPSGDELGGMSQLEAAYRAIESTFDAVNGGFGGAPKFPQQPVLEFLLRVRSESWAPRADEMLTVTLEEMANGGIHDQLGGGFARYSVDAQWLVPHFEKMLYDNAQLARIYLWAGVELKAPRFTGVATRTLDYLITELRHPDGGFYSSEDADSDGVEGKFYVWTLGELERTLGEEDADKAARFFGVTPEGNFDGSSILHRPTGDEWTDSMETIRELLLEERATRVRPGLDDKVIASWNGLVIQALAETGAVLDTPGYVEAARSAAAFVLDNLEVEGTLMRSWREGRTSVPGFSDDHAAMAVGLFALFAVTGEKRWFEDALRLTMTLRHFERPLGGYYTTRNDGEALIKRPSDLTDNPLPSGNSLAAEANLLAALYTGNAEFEESALGALKAASVVAERYPSMVGHHLALTHTLASGPRELAIVGGEWPTMAKEFWSRYRPGIALAVSTGAQDDVPLLSGRHEPGSTRAYLCESFVCELPVSTPEELRALLASR